MSWKQSGKVWELDVPPPQQIVLLALADNAHHDGTNCHPSVGLIAWKTGYSDRQVQRILRELEKAEIIEAQGKIGGGRGKTTLYHLHLDRGPQKAPWNPEGRQNVTVSPEPVGGVKGDISGVKGDTQMSPEPKEPEEQSEILDGSGRGREAAAEAWSKVMERAKADHSEFIVHVWFEPITPLSLEGGVLRLAAPKHVVGWTRERYSAAIAHVVGEGVSVEWVAE